MLKIIKVIIDVGLVFFIRFEFQDFFIGNFGIAVVLEMGKGGVEVHVKIIPVKKLWVFISSDHILVEMLVV